MREETGRPPSVRSDAGDEDTGLPGFRSWRSVYVVVTILFVVWVGLLTWMTFAFA